MLIFYFYIQIYHEYSYKLERKINGMKETEVTIWLKAEVAKETSTSRAQISDIVSV